MEWGGKHEPPIASRPGRLSVERWVWSVGGQFKDQYRRDDDRCWWHARQRWRARQRWNDRDWRNNRDWRRLRPDDPDDRLGQPLCRLVAGHTHRDRSDLLPDLSLAARVMARNGDG